MAAKANLNWNPFHFLPYDEQVVVKALFDPPTEQENNWSHCWSIDYAPPGLMVPITPLPALATGLANLMKSSYAHVYVERVNTGGNFCGHHPATPRFIIRNHPYFIPQTIDDLGDKRRSQILYDIVERIKAYYHDPDTLPVLQHANSDNRTSSRQRNSSRREALVNLLSVMVLNMDLCSFRVGQPTPDGGFFNYGLEWLAGKAKLSFSRAKRALSDLNDAMIISSYQYRELVDKENQEYIAHNASRKFDESFFDMLEIDQKKLHDARDHAYKKQRRNKTNGMSRKEQAVFDLNMKRAVKGLDPSDKRLKDEHFAKNEDEQKKAARLVKKRNEALFALLEENPELKNDSDALDAAVKARFEVLNL